jgi:hypothetical protein
VLEVGTTALSAESYTSHIVEVHATTEQQQSHLNKNIYPNLEASLSKDNKIPESSTSRSIEIHEPAEQQRSHLNENQHINLGRSLSVDSVNSQCVKKQNVEYAYANIDAGQ